MRKFGLIGKKLQHSFSKNYFAQKFNAEGIIDSSYALFELSEIKEFESILEDNLVGFNVTIPYKEAIIPFLDRIDPLAKNIGAVNTVKLEEGQLVGYNTDAYGFKRSLSEFLDLNKKYKALVLGSGGASKAIGYVLDILDIPFKIVSRTPQKHQISYQALKNEMIADHQLLINTTPLGMFPRLDEKPLINYSSLSSNHYLFDLIYNPDRTLFLEEGDKRGAQTKNGKDMLVYQAEKSWDIWNNLKT